MFYLELLENQTQKKALKTFLKKTFRHTPNISSSLSEFEATYLRPLENRIQELASCSEEQLPTDYIQCKRDLLEMHLWLDIFIESLSEIVSSPTLKSFNMRLQTDSAMLERLYRELNVYEERVVQLRAERIFARQDVQIHESLKKVKELLEKTAKKKNLDATKIDKILQDQDEFFCHIASFFHDRIPEWEKTVVSNARGLLFSSPERFPFSAVYTLQGNLYIFLEIVGHFIGIGAMKVGCRAVKLQTAEVFALIKSKTEFPEYTDPKQIEYSLDSSFYHTLREARNLKLFLDRQGIIQLRDRFAFEVNGIKQIYLIEDYFKDGSLEKYLVGPKASNLNLKQKISIAIQILAGARNIFELGYFHGDLKPDNILLDLNSFPIPIAAITDFSSASPLAGDIEPYSLIAHTVDWCSPELAAGLNAKDFNEERQEYLVSMLEFRDTWSLGLIFYVLFFEEELPWSKEAEDNKYNILANLKENWIPSRFSKRPFFTLIQKMTSVDPKKRPNSSQAVDHFVEESKKLAI